ncbi:MAG: LptF/LptG family permease [Spirochaetales bacterium]|nr:LptF/LptG family permease [Spirochaetales bacterium]
MIKRSYRQLYTYILKEVLVSFFLAFLFFFVIYFVNYILLMAEKILSKHVPLMDVLTLLICYMPQIVALSFPFSALVGSLMAIGRFSSDNEVLAFRASGVSVLRLFLPVFILSFIFSFISFLFNDYFLPIGFIKSSEIYRTLFSRNPGLELEPYSAKTYEDKVIITGNVKNNQIDDVIIIDKTIDNKKRIITAKNAYLLANKAQEGVISLELNDVFSHETDTGNNGNYDYAYAKEMVYNILVQNIISDGGQIKPSAREMTSLDVWYSILEKRKNLKEKRLAQKEKVEKLLHELTMEIELAREKTYDSPGTLSAAESDIEKRINELSKEREKDISDQSLRIYLLEFHKKFSHPFSCVFFIIFAFPVGLFAKRSGKILGFGIGVLMSGLYWAMLFVSYRTGYRVDFSPFLVIWFPNIIVLAAGLFFFFLRFKR